MKELSCKVKHNAKIANGIYAMTVALPEEVHAACGQFLNISTGNPAHLLKRPFGIMRSSGTNVTFCYQLKGEGTRLLSQAKPGDGLHVTLPLGNGFQIPESAKKIAVMLGTSPEVWLNLQSAYDQKLIEIEIISVPVLPPRKRVHFIDIHRGGINIR